MCVNKKGEKEHESKCSEFRSNKQTNVASRAKTSIKRQQSFGIKMNMQNQAVIDNKNTSQNLTLIPLNALRSKYNLTTNIANLKNYKKDNEK